MPLPPARAPGAFIWLHLHALPLDVVVANAARRPSEAILEALGGQYMQDCRYEFRRIYLPRTPVNKGKEKGRGSMTGPVTVREQAPVAARPPDCRSDPNPRLSCRPQSGAC